MPILLNIARHGQTYDNVKKIISLPDVDLTAIGVKQAEEFAEDVSQRGIKFDRIIASPLKRTMHTANIIAQNLGGLPVNTDERIREGDFRKWESRTVGELDAYFGSDKLSWDQYLELDFNGEIESFTETKRRLESFLAEYIPMLTDENLLLVSHNQTIKCLQKMAYGHCDDSDIINSKLYQIELSDDFIDRIS